MRPLSLDAIHGEVGVFEEAVDVFATGKEADADARGDDDFVFSDANRLGDGGQKLLADLLGVVDGAKIGEQHDELVAAHSADGVGLANAGLEAFGDLAEDRVAGLMPKRIVDPLEVVEVDHHDGEIVLRSLARSMKSFEPVAKQGAGGKAGERVVMRDMVDVLVGALAFGQVVGDADEAGDAIPRCRAVR